MDILPLRTEPIFKDKIWGGNRISALYPLYSCGENVGEVWILSENDKAISEFVEKHGIEALCGAGCGEFPLLIKLIDAREWLSVQVHPDRESALRLPDAREKNEMWYILEAESSAEIVCGFGGGEISFDNLIRKKVSAGDVIYIPAGLVHSIGGGILLLEVQQNSDTTYRLYDYDRVDEHGEKRSLHIAEATECIRPIDAEITKCDNSSRGVFSLCKTEHFSVDSIVMSGGEELSFPSGAMRYIFCLSGGVRVGDGFIEPYTGLLIPYAFGGFTVICEENAQLIVATV